MCRSNGLLCVAVFWRVVVTVWFTWPLCSSAPAKVRVGIHLWTHIGASHDRDTACQWKSETITRRFTTRASRHGVARFIFLIGAFTAPPCFMLDLCWDFACAHWLLVVLVIRLHRNNLLSVR